MNRGYEQNNMNMSNMPRENEDDMYPEVYRKLAPICDQLIKEMENKYGNIYLSEDLLNQMKNEAIRRMGMDENGDSIPTMREFGRRDDFDRHHFRHYDRSVLSDIAGILFLNRIFGRRRPYWRWR